MSHDTRTNDIEGQGIAAGAGAQVRMGADANRTIDHLVEMMQSDQRERHQRQRTIDDRDSELMKRLRGLEWRVGALIIAFVAGAMTILLLMAITIWLVIDRYMAMIILRWFVAWAVGCAGAVALAWRVGHP